MLFIYNIYVCVSKVTLYLSLSLTFHTLFHPQFERILIKRAKLGYLEMGHQFRRLAQSYYFLTKTIYILWIVKFKTKSETLVRINWGEETSLVPFFFFPCTLFSSWLLISSLVSRKPGQVTEVYSTLQITSLLRIGRSIDRPSKDYSA